MLVMLHEMDKVSFHLIETNGYHVKAEINERFTDLETQMRVAGAARLFCLLQPIISFSVVLLLPSLQFAYANQANGHLVHFLQINME